MDKKVPGFELQRETFLDGLAKLNAQTDLSIAVELPLKEHLSDPNITDPPLSADVPSGTVREVIERLCQLDRRFTWSRYKNTLNVYPINPPKPSASNFMERSLPDASIHISEPSQGIFEIIASLPGPLEQIAFSQSGELPNYPRTWDLPLHGLTIRQAFDVIAERTGAGYGWSLGGANEFRVVRFHAKLMPVSTSQASTHAPTAERSYAEVVSVRVDPATIHLKNGPKKATVYAQVLAHGNIPPGATATLNLETHPAQQSGVKICYSEEEQTLQLDVASPVTVEFPLMACPNTMEGKVTVSVRLRRATPPVRIEESPSYQSWSAELSIAIP